MAFLGYVKIPREAVMLSIAQEEAFKTIIKAVESKGIKSVAYRKALEAQKAFTMFLRSGRLIT
jgi:hypothetical protein